MPNPAPFVAPPDGSPSPDAAWHLLQVSARLLLEYNTRAHDVQSIVEQLGRRLGIDLQAIVGYREVTLSGPGGRTSHARIHELRVDVAVSIEIERTLEGVAMGRLGAAEAVDRLHAIEATALRHRRGVVLLLFGLAGSAIACLLQADTGAIVVSGVSSALGLLARQSLGRHAALLFANPFVAGLVGAIIGGLAIRLGWTATPGICLIVPALMVVPGPHLINGVYDVLDNQMPSGTCRLALATGLLVATALGVVLGARLTLGWTPLEAGTSQGLPLTFALDVALAGVAACGFSAFYNAPWRVLWVSLLCGMVGHGVRYASLGQGLTIATATLAGCFVVGLMADLMASRRGLPFSAVAFAGAVPMMPGLFIYQAIAGALRLSTADQPDPALAAATLAHAVTSTLVVAALVLGLVLGARLAVLGRR